MMMLPRMVRPKLFVNMLIDTRTLSVLFFNLKINLGRSVVV